MWHPEEASGDQDSATPAGSGKAPRPGSLNVSQHSTVNPTPFSSYRAAWAIGPPHVNDFTNQSRQVLRVSSINPAGSIIHAPSDLLPQGLLTTPQPSTKGLASRGLTISGTDASFGTSSTGNGTSGESPGTSTGGVVLQPLDSLVLPSPSLLPGGVHSLPTPTSSCSQIPKPHETYVVRASPADSDSSKGASPSPGPVPTFGARTAVSQQPPTNAGNKQPEPGPAPTPFRNSSGGSNVVDGGAGSGRIGAGARARAADASSSSYVRSNTGSQLSEPSRATGPTAPHHPGYGGAATRQGMQYATGPPPPPHGMPGQYASAAATSVGAKAAQQTAPTGSSPAMGYPANASYMPPGLPPTGPGQAVASGNGAGAVAGPSVWSNATAGGGSSYRSSSAGAGGASGVRPPLRDGGSGGSGWRGNRNPGPSGGVVGAAPGVPGGGVQSGGKPAAQQGSQHQQQQQAQQQPHVSGPMVHEGGAVGSYGMTAHMHHPGPYAMYGMVAPGIVMPQVIPPIVGSPHSMDGHGPLAPHHHHHHHHQQHHQMGPMMVHPHGPSMAMGVGMNPAGMGMGPHHPMHHPYTPHGPMGHPHAGPHHHHAMHTMAGHQHHGGGYPHPQQHMSGGFPASSLHRHGGGVGPGGYGPQPYSLEGMVQPYGGGRGGNASNGKGPVVGSHQQQQPYGAGGASGPKQLVVGTKGAGAEAGSAGVGPAASGGRDSPRGRTVAAREKTEKGRPGEPRERKPGNSRAPALVAQCAANMPALDGQLRDLVRHLTPGEEELAKHATALDRVRELVLSRWPHFKVHLFGSAANGLAIAGANEIDITLEAPEVPWDDHAGKAAVVSELGELATGGKPVAAAATPAADGEVVVSPDGVKVAAVEEGACADASGEGRVDAAPAPVAGVDGVAGAEAAADKATADDEAAGAAEAAHEISGPAAAVAGVSALPKARTPIVKLTVSETQTRVDITVNNLLALSNTRLLGHYCEVDPRLRQLVLLVKHWARTRSVNDAYRGSLSSYAYAIICTWLLQQRQPPILPVLQQRQPPTYEATVGPWHCTYDDRVDQLTDFGAANKESLAQLLVAFFDHWAWRHDYNGSVVCVRTGGTMAKTAKDWTKRQGNERHLMCIEDPFELSHDLGRTIDKAAVQVLRREFERAARIFASNPDPLPELLAPLTAEEEAVIAAALQSRKKTSKDKEKAKQAAASAAAEAVAAACAGGAEGADGEAAVSEVFSQGDEDEAAEDASVGALVEAVAAVKVTDGDGGSEPDTKSSLEATSQELESEAEEKNADDRCES